MKALRIPPFPTVVPLALAIAFSCPAFGDALPCFPGAEGFGVETPGGRGGRVIKVTNLRSEGPGSLQAALSEEGPRIVVFDVSGVIYGDLNIEHGQVTIAGQTAPGAGITVRGMLGHESESPDVYISDVVVRFMRFRPYRSFGDQGDAIQIGNVDRFVLDHVSCAWANDETIDIYTARDVTVQWCTIEESDIYGHIKGWHNYGLIGGPRSLRATIHHNLFAHQSRRNPALANGPGDFRNNVVYNFRDGFSHEGHPPNNLGFNIIGNYYKMGQHVKDIYPFQFVDGISYYLRDNYFEGIGIVQDPWETPDYVWGTRKLAERGVKADKETPVPTVTTHTPQEAYDLVLESAGCLPRDFVTLRTVREVEKVRGRWGRREPGDLLEGLSPEAPLPDRDSDGMPDEWERANGLNPGDASDRNKKMKSGYTAVEEYCNQRAQALIDACRQPGE